MDINTLRGIATLLVLVAFIGITVWAYSSYKKKDFEEAANLPFADEPDDNKAPREQQDARSNKE
ncbi:cbb3-type cytochrome oxidase subunit 3 [Halopseudomonas phragmitis]|uniref:Cytochrome oxidase n=2 Tax=Pseudomonadaceae TaxID=135621 RepID=A0A1V0B897_9GAMM|nr:MULTISPECIES: cbb3-type cytochrome c oxidase subunit 3 [Pseudomonadaceae]AQZ96155.1 cytochrome oxidase [Halopseudomonas phragmitis]PAU89102.1 cbb3-type cytochrome c oxidase subunit 3 [Pseudomonas sp. WN033]RHW20994.1 cbb3-type cytochrome c oxidase subunit 3 [Pseudomonas jilinensis]